MKISAPNPAAHSGAPIVAVVGPSACGKSAGTTREVLLPILEGRDAPAGEGPAAVDAPVRRVAVLR